MDLRQNKESEKSAEKPENSPYPAFLIQIYQRFTNIFGESDLLLSRIHTMKNKTERIRYGFDDYRVIIS